MQWPYYGCSLPVPNHNHNGCTSHNVCGRVYCTPDYTGYAEVDESKVTVQSGVAVPTCGPEEVLIKVTR